MTTQERERILILQGLEEGKIETMTDQETEAS